MAVSAQSSRVGNAEREHVTALLQRHASEGRLTLDEFEERVAEVTRARYGPELDHALRELPLLAGDAPPTPPGGRAALVWQHHAAVAMVAGLLAMLVLVATTGGFVFWPLWMLFFFGRAFGGRRRGGPRGPGSLRGVTSPGSGQWPGGRGTTQWV